MNTRPVLVAIAAFLIPLASGCGKSSPAAPTAPPEPEMEVRTTVTITTFEVIKDGDGIEGKGEFYWFHTIGGSGRATWATVGTGESYTLNRRQSLQAAEGYPVRVGFRCSELDVDILGNEYNDSDMDNRERFAVHTATDDLDGRWYITLGNDNCKVRMHYTIATTLVEAD